MPNTKHVTVKCEVPRDPGAYRATAHIQQQLKHRVPEHLHSRVIRECIEDGHCKGTTPPDAASEDQIQSFRFEQEIEDTLYGVVVGIRRQAILGAKKHRAITVMEVTD
jgi:hypothetical protein